ncbi:hypothetical protein SLEP1_g40946 [Rubroshorea leprosula]|uniref:Uncharacterized protein n=1 Tax=Rubroshorea leprosula TaxID=152421 RepID=A0AAV5L5C9_9ROSI|nr:hypothetical protein SLEP1_g40946 [Rubroshorea leprosula]
MDGWMDDGFEGEEAAHTSYLEAWQRRVIVDNDTRTKVILIKVLG